ncbi:MAG TPA: hypothetical protein EYG60_03020 [Campylobacterales bacterium]|nr:hypothetical protein [Campylobacterales bacterium]
MAKFPDPFNDTLTEEEMLKKIENKLREDLKRDRIRAYIFVNGALENRDSLKQLFMESEEFPPELREQYLEIDKQEKEYMEQLEKLKEELKPHKPKAEAYYLTNEILKDEEVRERFEMIEYFPRRERVLYYHLEFLFSNDGKYLMEKVLPKLIGVKGKNLLAIIRFKLFDAKCYRDVEDDDDLEIKKEKETYIDCCEQCIDEVARFGNMEDREGVFHFVGIDEGKENLFNLSIRFLLSLIEFNITRYLQLEITQEEIRFTTEIEQGEQLLEHARRVKKPIAETNEARELVEKLEIFRRFISYANEYQLIRDISKQKLGEKAEELIEIIESSQKVELKENILKADELNLNSENIENIDEVEENIPPRVMELKKEFLKTEQFIRDVKESKKLKKERLEKLIKDSKKGEPYYYKYINRALYILKFFNFDIEMKLQDFLKDTDKYGGAVYKLHDPLERFYRRPETIKEYIDNTYNTLSMIYKKQFATIKRFDDGYELAKQINSILLKFASTIKELNNPGGQ